jgi:histidine triad (HIT) family protein
MASDCLFCKIIAGEIPSEQVLSSEKAVAFRDIDAQAPTHVLVVPRVHIDSADELESGDEAEIGALMSLAREVAHAEGLSPKSGGGGYRLVFNVGEDALNSVPHLHLHVLGGRKFEWPPG